MSIYNNQHTPFVVASVKLKCEIEKESESVDGRVILVPIPVGRDWVSLQLYRKVCVCNPGISESEFVLACETARSRAFSGDVTGRLPKEQFLFTGLLCAASLQLHLMEPAAAAAATAVVAAALVGQALVLPRLLGIRQYAVAPVIDMLNHDGRRGAARCGVAYEALQGSFSVVAEAPFAANKEVCGLCLVGAGG